MSNIIKQPNLLDNIQLVTMSDFKMEPTKHVGLRLSAVSYTHLDVYKRQL